jgi:hypothetical protein
MIPVGWDRTDPAEWAHLPCPFTRWLLIRRFRKEMRGW